MNTNKLIFFAISILLVLSTLFYWLSHRPKNPSKTTGSPFPTVSLDSKSSPLSEGKQRGVSTKSKTPIVYQDPQIKQLNNLKKQLPLTTNEFSLAYSGFLDRFFIQKTASDSADVINHWANQNGFTNIFQNQSLFIVTDNSQPIQTLIAEQENIYQNNHELLLISAPTINPVKKTTNSTDSTDLTDLTNSNISTKNDLQMIADLFSLLFNSPDITSFSTPSAFPPTSSSYPPNPFTPLISPNKLTGQSSPISPISTPASLQSLITEASQKVGVPYKILEGIISIENPAVFNLTDVEIGQKSNPGSGITCPIANCSEQGPMQMTTGRDSDGRTDCPKCCWNGKCTGYCPNAWGQYGNSISKYGGYIHTPNPCDLRDNIFAAALKLKTDSGATSPTEWTQEEANRAGLRYHGNCSYPYSRLGNRTYCQYLWDYYKNQ